MTCHAVIGRRGPGRLALEGVDGGRWLAASLPFDLHPLALFRMASRLFSRSLALPRAVRPLPRPLAPEARRLAPPSSPRPLEEGCRARRPRGAKDRPPSSPALTSGRRLPPRLSPVRLPPEPRDRGDASPAAHQDLDSPERSHCRFRACRPFCPCPSRGAAALGGGASSERTAVLTSSLSPSLSRLPTCIFHGLQESQPHAQTATVGVYFDVGSRHDHKAGVAHFAEHVVSRPPAPLWRSSFLVAC